MDQETEKIYRIGEAAEILNLRPSVLRFWEEKFPQIEPEYTEKGQRVYTRNHITLLRRIRHLLHEQGMTIEGAKRVLEGSAVIDENDSGMAIALADGAFLEMLEHELVSIRNLLADSEE